jgi:hypothetical protein
MSAEMASGRVGIDAGEIPRVDRTKTQQRGAGAASAGISGSIYYIELGLERIECVLSEISAEMASGRAADDTVEIPRVDGDKAQPDGPDAISV